MEPRSGPTGLGHVQVEDRATWGADSTHRFVRYRFSRWRPQRECGRTRRSVRVAVERGRS
jgi:hypothetical protein